MRVFVSSVIRGLEPQRAAVSDAVASLGYAVIRSEEFGPSTDTPRRACMEAARTADPIVASASSAAFFSSAPRDRHGRPTPRTHSAFEAR